MGVLATLFGGTYAAVGGGSKATAATKAPPINASSSDEESFIKCALSQLTLFQPSQLYLQFPPRRNFLESANKDEKAKH